MTTSVKVTGLADLQRRLRTLADDVAGRAGRAAVNAGAQIIKRAAIDKAPELTGNLRRNIIVRRLPDSETDLAAEYIVTVRQGHLTKKQREKGLQPAFYARFVEFGTVHRAAQPFLRPAFDGGKAEALNAIVDRLRTRIEKAGG